MIFNTCDSAKWRKLAEEETVKIPFILINGRKESEKIGDSPIYIFSKKVLRLSKEGLFYFNRKRFSSGRIFIYDPNSKITQEY